jgi:hypothetical protein
MGSPNRLATFSPPVMRQTRYIRWMAVKLEKMASTTRQSQLLHSKPTTNGKPAQTDK